MKYALLIAALAATTLAAEPGTLRVRITGASAQARETLWNQLQEQGKQRGMSFQRVSERPEYTLLVSWSQNWSKREPPSAEIVAYEGESRPLFALECHAPFKKSWALGQCSRRVVERLTGPVPGYAGTAPGAGLGRD